MRAIVRNAIGWFPRTRPASAPEEGDEFLNYPSVRPEPSFDRIKCSSLWITG